MSPWTWRDTINLVVWGYVILALLGFAPSPFADKLDAHVAQGGVVVGAVQLTCYHSALLAKISVPAARVNPPDCFNPVVLENPSKFLGAR